CSRPPLPRCCGSWRPVSPPSDLPPLPTATQTDSRPHSASLPRRRPVPPLLRWRSPDGSHAWCRLAHHHDLPGRLRFVLFGVVELTVRGLMDSGGNSLHLAHAFPDGDPLLVRGEIAVHVLGHRLKLDGNRSRAAQSFHES